MVFHAFFEFLAYFISWQYYKYLEKDKIPISKDKQITIILGAAIGAGVLSKILGMLEHPQLLANLYAHPEYIMSAKTIVGGLIGGVIGVEIAKKIVGITSSTGDHFCYPLIIGIAIGRIGCFLMGASDGTWGNETDFFLAMDGGDGVMRHPTPLYEIAYLILLFGLIKFLENRIGLRNGERFEIFMFSYLSWRLLIDFIKPYNLLPYSSLSAIQIACVGGIAYYAILLIKGRIYKNGG